MKTILIILSMLLYISAEAQPCNIKGSWYRFIGNQDKKDSITIVFANDNSFHFFTGRRELTTTMDIATNTKSEASFSYEILEPEDGNNKAVVYTSDGPRQYIYFSFTGCDKMTMKLENDFGKTVAEVAEFTRIQ